MNLLAIDTSTASCSVAIFKGNRLLGEEVFTDGKTHSRHLLAMVHRILQEAGTRISCVDGIAITRGPGTFTGLRIGLSTVKGLAAAIQAPVVGVSSLAALAFPFRQLNRSVVAMIDARRGEVYHAGYRGGTQVAPTSVGGPDTVAAVLPEDATLVGSGATLYRHVFESRSSRVRFAEPRQHVIRAASVGMLAMARFNEQDVDAIEALIPDYIRKSDAQIQMPGTLVPATTPGLA